MTRQYDVSSRTTVMTLLQTFLQIGLLGAGTFCAATEVLIVPRRYVCCDYLLLFVPALRIYTLGHLLYL